MTRIFRRSLILLLVVFAAVLVAQGTETKTAAPAVKTIDQADANNFAAIQQQQQMLQTQMENIQLKQQLLNTQAQQAVLEAYRKAGLSPAEFDIDFKTGQFVKRQAQAAPAAQK